uniref:Putative secreted protein n=1 Tax=Anopheles marajoara TaxID=58244 RepID=A0A2M4CF98_9DIPT
MAARVFVQQRAPVCGLATIVSAACLPPVAIGKHRRIGTRKDARQAPHRDKEDGGVRQGGLIKKRCLI